MQSVEQNIWKKFDEITNKFSRVRFMNEKQAVIIRDLIANNDAKNILEIGFFKGKSSIYIAAVLEDLGRGSLLTIDRPSALTRAPNIHDLMRMTDLSHRAQPIVAFRSFTWELQKLINQAPRPRFDLCYFDGGHIWDSTGFGVLLVDMLLRPGGLLVLDDMDWKVKTSGSYRKHPKRAASFSEDEAATPSVRRTWELILPHLGYTDMYEIPEVRWGVARKPGGAHELSAVRSKLDAGTLL